MTAKPGRPRSPRLIEALRRVAEGATQYRAAKDCKVRPSQIARAQAHDRKGAG